MRATLVIAVNAFRESVRDKVLYNLVLFAIVLIGASYLIGQLTAGHGASCPRAGRLDADCTLRNLRAAAWEWPGSFLAAGFAG